MDSGRATWCLLHRLQQLSTLSCTNLLPTLTTNSQQLCEHAVASVISSCFAGVGRLSGSSNLYAVLRRLADWMTISDT